MSRGVLATAGLLLLAACGGAPALPAEELLLHVTLGAEEVAPGEGFPVTVVRAWSKDLEPSAWDERALAPLVLRLEATEHREDARRVEETYRYRGYAFSRRDLSVPPAKLTARPRGGGPERSTSSPRLRVRVKPTVEAAAPGAPELPGEPLAEPTPRWRWFAGGGLALLTIVLWAWRRRRVSIPPLPAAAPPAPPAHVVALERLRVLAARAPVDAAEVTTDVIAACEVVRDYVGARWSVRTPERTSEEVLQSVAPSLETESLATLGTLLSRGDAAKFAARIPTSGERAAVLADAAAFVTNTGSA